jgi:hypothetical protein
MVTSFTSYRARAKMSLGEKSLPEQHRRLPFYFRQYHIHGITSSGPVVYIGAVSANSSGFGFGPQPMAWRAFFVFTLPAVFRKVAALPFREYDFSFHFPGNNDAQNCLFNHDAFNAGHRGHHFNFRRRRRQNEARFVGNDNEVRCDEEHAENVAGTTGANEEGRRQDA